MYRGTLADEDALGEPVEDAAAKNPVIWELNVGAIGEQHYLYGLRGRAAVAAAIRAQLGRDRRERALAKMCTGAPVVVPVVARARPRERRASASRSSSARAPGDSDPPSARREAGRSDARPGLVGARPRLLIAAMAESVA
jgi:hypothetical protein